MTGERRVSLITAGTGGIGRGIADALAVRGHLVVVSGRDAEKGCRVAKDIAPDATFIVADALVQGDVEALVDGVLERHGRLDVLVNNAGGSSGFAPVHALSDAAWRQAFDWNVSSAFWAIRRAAPGMSERRFGRIINISSVQGKQANQPNASHYVMAKHALNGFTKAVALEYGKSGVTCNALCIGAVETELMQTAGPQAAKASGLSYEQYKQRYADQSMTGRLTTVAEVGAMAALLASEEGGGVTGALINVDGGVCAY